MSSSPDLAGVRARRATSFGPAAQVYAETRPTYPAEALRWATEGVDPVQGIVDVGAGTGKLTQVLLEVFPAATITAVEPSEGMLAALDLPVVKVLAPAEATTLGAGVADVCFAAQAWHWFDPVTAPAEMARILRPGGVMVVVANMRDTGVPWVRELSLAMGSHEDALTGEAMVDEPLEIGPGFAPTTLGAFHHEQTLTVDQVVGLVHSRSHWIIASPQRQAEVDEAVRRVAHAAADGEGLVRIPYRTSVWRAVRL